MAFSEWFLEMMDDVREFEEIQAIRMNEIQDEIRPIENEISELNSSINRRFDKGEYIPCELYDRISRLREEKKVLVLRLKEVAENML